jgi:putative copper export protein
VDALDTIRLFLHVLAASVWVGGQLVLAGLVPALRRLGPDAPRTVARRFNVIAWPAFWLAVATGVWNVAVVGDEGGGVLVAKLVAVVASGVAAWAHAHARSTRGVAVWGALTGLAALAALLLGVMLAGA